MVRHARVTIWHKYSRHRLCMRLWYRSKWIPETQRQLQKAGTTRHMAERYQQLYFVSPIHRL